MADNTDSKQIAPDFLNMLICPVTRSSLRQEEAELVGEVGGLRYPIRDGMPVLLPNEARLPADVKDLEAFKQKYKDQIPE